VSGAADWRLFACRRPSSPAPRGGARARLSAAWACLPRPRLTPRWVYCSPRCKAQPRSDRAHQASASPRPWWIPPRCAPRDRPPWRKHLQRQRPEIHRHGSDGPSTPGSGPGGGRCGFCDRHPEPMWRSPAATSPCQWRSARHRPPPSGSAAGAMANIARTSSSPSSTTPAGIPLAAGVLFPSPDCAAEPDDRGAAMAFSSVSNKPVVMNALRLAPVPPPHRRRLA